MPSSLFIFFCFNKMISNVCFWVCLFVVFLYVRLLWVIYDEDYHWWLNENVVLTYTTTNPVVLWICFVGKWSTVIEINVRIYPIYMHTNIDEIINGALRGWLPAKYINTVFTVKREMQNVHRFSNICFENTNKRCNDLYLRCC